MNSENDFNKDIISDVAEILSKKPTYVLLNLVLGLTCSAFATIHEANDIKSKVDIDPTQIRFYEDLLKAHGIEVDICFMNPLPRIE